MMTLRELMYKGIVGINAEQNASLLWLFILSMVLIAIAGYLLGSINTAIIISKKKFGKDIRESGSGNAGTTNMMRTYGKLAGIATFAGDILKAVVSVYFGMFLCGTMGAYIGGFTCILGHMFPVYYHFKGGKGVAVAAVMILITEPSVFLMVAGTFLILLLSTKYVSLASIAAAGLYPMMLYNFIVTKYGYSDFRAIIALIIGILIIFMHRSNIKRLREGKENKINLKKKPKEKKKAEDAESVLVADEAPDQSEKVPATDKSSAEKNYSTAKNRNAKNKSKSKK